MRSTNNLKQALLEQEIKKHTLNLLKIMFLADNSFFCKFLNLLLFKYVIYSPKNTKSLNKNEINFKSNNIYEIDLSKINIEINTELSLNCKNINRENFCNDNDVIIIYLRELFLKSKKEISFTSNIKYRTTNSQTFFIYITYKLFVQELNYLIPSANIYVQKAFIEYKEFCVDNSLISPNSLIARTANKHFYYDLFYNLYFDYNNIDYKNCTYIGLYAKKEIRAIGKIQKIIQIKNSVIENEHILNQFEKTKIIETIHNFRLKNNIIILVDKFYKTSFKRKDKMHHIQKCKYINIDKLLKDNYIRIINTESNNSTSELAEILNTIVW